MDKKTCSQFAICNVDLSVDWVARVGSSLLAQIVGRRLKAIDWSLHSSPYLLLFVTRNHLKQWMNYISPKALWCLDEHQPYQHVLWKESSVLLVVSSLLGGHWWASIFEELLQKLRWNRWFLVYVVMSNVCQIQFMFGNYRKLSSDTCSFFLDPLEWQVLSYLEIPFSIRDVTYDGIVINEN